MKKYCLLFISLTLWVACAPDSSSPTSNAASVTTSVTSPATGPVQTGEPVKVDPDILSPHVGIWHYQSIAGIKDAKTRDFYTGRWIDLKGDQTFTSGVWQDQTNSGKWDFDPESQLINFFYDKNEGLDIQYKLNGPSDEITIFLGNTPKNPKGIQIKMVRYPDRPTE